MCQIKKSLERLQFHTLCHTQLSSLHMWFHFSSTAKSVEETRAQKMMDTHGLMVSVVPTSLHDALLWLHYTFCPGDLSLETVICSQ